MCAVVVMCEQPGQSDVGAGRQLGAAAAAASCRPGKRGHKNSGLPRRLANTHCNPVKIFKLYNNVLQSAVRWTEGEEAISVASPPERCSSAARLAVQPDCRQRERDFPPAAQRNTARVTCPPSRRPQLHPYPAMWSRHSGEWSRVAGAGRYSCNAEESLWARTAAASRPALNITQHYFCTHSKNS